MDLAASIVTALATVGLAAVATYQIRAAREQTEATLDIAKETREAISAAREQTKATLDIAKQTREAAQRQWQPRVIAHRWQSPIRGALPSGQETEAEAGARRATALPETISVLYYLSNDGTGPAFNVEHAVEVNGVKYRVGDVITRTIVAGQQRPPMHDATGLPRSRNPFEVTVPREQVENDPHGYILWTSFENLLGERWEVLNDPSSLSPAVFRRAS